MRFCASEAVTLQKILCKFARYYPAASLVEAAVRCLQPRATVRRRKRRATPNVKRQRKAWQDTREAIRAGTKLLIKC